MPSFSDASSLILWQAATSATPLVLAGYGELVAQRAGVINVGIEGVMLMGAICAFAAATLTGSAAAGLLAAAAVGLLIAALFAAVTTWCRADQVVTGTAINLLAAGASATLYTMLRDHPAATNGEAPFFDRITIPLVDGIPLIGHALANQYALSYVVAFAGLLLWYLLRRTRLGLVITALGDAPDAADAAGIRVRWWRTACVLFAGLCAGLAGSFLSIMALHGFTINMTDGRGFLVLALVIFGRWSLPGLVLGTLLFGILDGVQTTLASMPGATTHFPPSLFAMLPYAATLIALAMLTRSSAGPVHMGRPWPAE